MYRRTIHIQLFSVDQSEPGAVPYKTEHDLHHRFALLLNEKKR